MTNLTFEQLPQAVTKLCEDLAFIKQHIIGNGERHFTDPDQWFDLSELCQYHPDKPSKATVYGWVNAGTVPVHKSAKKLRFLKSEIDAWLKEGRKRTNAEAASEAEAYLQAKKKRG